MKNILNKKILFLGLSLGIVSCELDTMNYQDIPTENAYEGVQDVQNGLNGAYAALGSSEFYGRNFVATGDIAADVAQGTASSGHFFNFGNYVISPTDPDLTAMWDYGYKVIDRCVRTINGGNALLARKDELFLSNNDVANLNLYLSQCYALKALAQFSLVNIFGLPYQKGRDNLGIALLTDKPLEAFTNITRSTVGQTYDLTLENIASAKEFLQKALDAKPSSSFKFPSAFYLNESAILALEARVNLFMGNNEVAKASAQKAIDLKATGDKPSNEAYVSMWSSLAITEEDIFTICKTEDDNLSANSLNTLYGSYEAYLVETTLTRFGENDIRLGLIDGDHPKKFDGIPTSEATSNIPVFRKSEMYLIIAEVEARAGNIEAAKTALLYTAKRNLDIVSEADLPNTQEELLTFISDENVREFFEEGHRFYNARRTGELISVAGGTYDDFDVSSFVYPIPADEINAGFGIVQNDGWEKNLPK